MKCASCEKEITTANAMCHDCHVSALKWSYERAASAGGFSKRLIAMRERLAELEHSQWCEWSQHLVSGGENISEVRLMRWRRLWVPYSRLSEAAKEADRDYADRVIKALIERKAGK